MYAEGGVLRRGKSGEDMGGGLMGFERLVGWDLSQI